MQIMLNEGIKSAAAGDVLVTNTGYYMVIKGCKYFLLDLEYSLILCVNGIPVTFENTQDLVKYLQENKNEEVQRMITDEHLCISEV